MSNKLTRGRPTKYLKSTAGCVTGYTKECLKNNIFPTIEGLALKLGVSVRTLYGWEAEYPEFLQTMDEIRSTQKDLLITNGLRGVYNTRFAIFLLKANHNMSEKEALIQADQNNFMNISPEVLATALKMMEEDEKM